MVVGVVHALVVSVRYHVGSFDDDGSYVMAARAIAAGHGLTSRMAAGYPLIGVYPPGYPAILSPFALIWRSSVLDFRFVSLAMFIAIFPLTWLYLGRRGVREPFRLAVLALLALNPVLGTYATMVMAEASFVVVLLLMLLLADRWERQPMAVTWAGVGTVVCAAWLVWMKEAGIGLVVGLVAWLLLRRLWRKAVLAAAAPAALIAPLLIVRLLIGASLIGSRYSDDLGGVFTGGLVGHVLHVAPKAAWTYVHAAVPKTIDPTGMGALMGHGLITSSLHVVSEMAAPFVVIGFVVWCRRHADAACLVVPAYLVETLVYPFTNERRVVLVLPVILAWYVLGAAWAILALRWAAGHVVGWAQGRQSDTARTGPVASSAVAGGAVAGGAAVPGAGVLDHGGMSGAAVGRRIGQVFGWIVAAIAMAAPIVVAMLLLVELAGQFPRDYLYDLWGHSSAPGGSGYMNMLHDLGTPQQVVETDYRWTTALYTGHRTLGEVYAAPCDPAGVNQAIQTDDAGFVLTAELNGGGVVDDSCILPVVAELPNAVRLYRSPLDAASVFELVGAGTANPGLRALTSDAVLTASQPITQVKALGQTSGDPAGTYPELASTKGAATLTWSWSDPVAISQISLGSAGAAGAPGAAGPVVGATTSVQVSVRSADGRWQVVDSAPGAVGPGSHTQFVLVHLPAGVGGAVTAVRVVVAVTGSANVEVQYFQALGPKP